MEKEHPSILSQVLRSIRFDLRPSFCKNHHDRRVGVQTKMSEISDSGSSNQAVLVRWSPISIDAK